MENCSGNVTCRRRQARLSTPFVTPPDRRLPPPDHGACENTQGRISAPARRLGATSWLEASEAPPEGEAWARARPAPRLGVAPGTKLEHVVDLLACPFSR